jgi:hypothetical protein
MTLIIILLICSIPIAFSIINFIKTLDHVKSYAKQHNFRDYKTGGSDLYSFTDELNGQKIEGGINPGGRALPYI